MIVTVSVWGLDVDISLWGHHSMHHSMPGGNKWVIIRHFGITVTTPSPAEGMGGERSAEPRANHCSAGQGRKHSLEARAHHCSAGQDRRTSQQWNI